MLIHSFVFGELQYVMKQKSPSNVSERASYIQCDVWRATINAVNYVYDASQLWNGAITVWSIAMISMSDARVCVYEPVQCVLPCGRGSLTNNVIRISYGFESQRHAFAIQCMNLSPSKHIGKAYKTTYEYTMHLYLDMCMYVYVCKPS